MFCTQKHTVCKNLYLASRVTDWDWFVPFLFVGTRDPSLFLKSCSLSPCSPWKRWHPNQIQWQFGFSATLASLASKRFKYFTKGRLALHVISYSSRGGSEWVEQHASFFSMLQEILMLIAWSACWKTAQWVAMTGRCGRQHTVISLSILKLGLNYFADACTILLFPYQQKPEHFSYWITILGGGKIYIFLFCKKGAVVTLKYFKILKGIHSKLEYVIWYSFPYRQ